MKFRQDFVTNSSSTSFIISLRNEWNEKSFYKSIGLLDDSAFRSLFAELYKAINFNKEEITAYIKKYYPEEKSVESFLLSQHFSREIVETVSQLINDGRTVYYGKLSSEDGGAVEAFFCMESFLVCNDDIYFNGEISVW